MSLVMLYAMLSGLACLISSGIPGRGGTIAFAVGLVLIGVACSVSFARRRARRELDATK